LPSKKSPLACGMGLICDISYGNYAYCLIAIKKSGQVLFMCWLSMTAQDVKGDFEFELR
jgi:hypothetical protein